MKMMPLVLRLFWTFGLCFAIANADLFHYKKSNLKKPTNFNAYKASLTQHGYIQFLRYEVNVPDIKEFTYCIWIKSINFQNTHPIFSYSLHEHERLIRGNIGPHGSSINLFILENKAYSIPAQLQPHKWYHICQSWDSESGHASLHVNGALLHSEYNDKIQGITVPGHGDIVIGQEYTDFDKGYDDGIEGSIYGFNMILESVYMKKSEHLHTNALNRKYNDLISMKRIPSLSAISHNDLFAGQTKHPYDDINFNFLRRNHIITRPNRPLSPNVINSLTNLRPPKPQIRMANQTSYTKKIRIKRYADKKVIDTLPLGMQLVEMGYKHCLNGRGGPLTGDKVLINWSLTEVRVFGGAILKSAKPLCGNF